MSGVLGLPQQGETWYADIRTALTYQASPTRDGGRTEHRLIHARCAHRHPDGTAAGTDS